MKSSVLGIIRKESKSLDKFKDIPKQDVFSLFLGYPNFLGGSNLGGNLGDNNEK